MTDTTHECWSRDNEWFGCTSLGELIDENDDFEVGQIVFVADAEPADTSGLVDAGDVIEMLGERAYDNYGESAEDWPDVSPEQKKELDDLLQGWIEKNAPARFWSVTNVREYVLTADDLPATQIPKQDPP